MKVGPSESKACVQSRISIAMAVYNGERFIQQQLESFLRQTRLPDELVVSDDASTDRSVEIVREFAAHAPFPVKILVNEQNLGCSKNFERAFCECTGDIIFLSDWDDVWYPDKLLVMEKAFAQSPKAGVAICGWQTVDENLQPIAGSSNVFLRKLARALGATSEALADGATFNHWLPPPGGGAFRARFKPLILPFPDAPEFRRGGHDYFLLWAIVGSGAAGVLLIPDNLYAYRRHAAAQWHYGEHRSWVGAMRVRLTAPNQRRLFLLKPLVARLASASATEFCVNPTLRAEVLDHWRARCSLPRSRAARVPLILKELATLRYHRFSSGFRTAVKDLLFDE